MKLSPSFYYSSYPTDSIRYGSRRTGPEQFGHRIRREDSKR
jgi:hypothetical protein